MRSTIARDVSNLQDDPTFSINQWPSCNQFASSTLQSYVDTHSIHPLPAFSVDGDIIAPLDYQRRLEGARVWVEFVVTHRFEDDIHVLEAVIDKIRVVSPPESHDSFTLSDLHATDPADAS